MARRRGFRAALDCLAQPVEVVFARVGKEVVGALLLRRKWMEEAFAQNCNDEVQQKTQWPSIASGACDTWLNYLPSELGPWLSRQAEFLPEGLGILNHGDFESILDLLDDSTPEEIDRWLQVPIVLDTVRDFARNGNPQQRGQLKKILQRWAPDGRGAPMKQLAEREDVRIAEEVEAAKSRLAEGFKVRVEHRKGGGYQSSSEVIARELVKMGYAGNEINAIVQGRLVSGAAHKLVALNRHRPVENIRATASRGRKYLRRR